MKKMFLELYAKHKFVFDRITIGAVLFIPIEIIIFIFSRKAAFVFFAGFLLGCVNYIIYYLTAYITVIIGSNKAGRMQFMSFTVRYSIIAYFLVRVTEHYGFYSIYGAVAIVFIYFISSFYTLIRSVISKLMKSDTPEW